jgi:hypothetical protein
MALAIAIRMNTTINGQIAIDRTRCKRTRRASLEMLTNSRCNKRDTRVTVPMAPRAPNNAALVIEDTVEVVTVEIIIPRIFQPSIPERGILRNRDQE